MAKKLVFPESKIRSFCKKHHIILMALFGSVLTSNFSAKSDVDILVQFKKNQGPNFLEFIDMEAELSEIIGRKVDLNRLIHAYFDIDNDRIWKTIKEYIPSFILNSALCMYIQKKKGFQRAKSFGGLKGSALDLAHPAACDHAYPDFVVVHKTYESFV
jgi:uncharacterized protein